MTRHRAFRNTQTRNRPLNPCWKSDKRSSRSGRTSTKYQSRGRKDCSMDAVESLFRDISASISYLRLLRNMCLVALRSHLHRTGTKYPSCGNGAGSMESLESLHSGWPNGPMPRTDGILKTIFYLDLMVVLHFQLDFFCWFNNFHVGTFLDYNIVEIVLLSLNLKTWFQTHFLLDHFVFDDRAV